MKPFNNIAVSPTEPEPKSDVWIQHSKNLFDENTWIVGKGILGTNGQEYSNSDWSSSNYIPIKENMSICFSYETIGNGELAISEYDVNKTFLKQIYNSFSSNYNNKIVINTLSNTKFVRLSSRNDKENEKFQLEYGTTRTNYEPYAEDDIKVNDDGIYSSVLNKTEEWKKLFTGFIYRKVNNAVEVLFNSKEQYSLTSNQWLTLGTLPVGYRPKVNLYVSILITESNIFIPAMLTVDATGAVSIKQASGKTVNTNEIRGFSSYSIL